jgi:SSS family solute:Na+ symporter
MTDEALRHAIIVGSVIVYVVATSILAYVLRSRNNAQFMVGGRTLPAIVVAVLLMSEFIGAKSTVGTAQEAFERGMAASWSVIAAAIGFLLLSLFFARQIYTSKQHTISGIVEQRFGNGARIAVSIVMIYALLLVNVGNYLSGGAALAQALGVNLTVSTLIVAAFSSIYFVFGGLKSIAYVTVLHSILKLVGVGLLVWVAMQLTGGIQPIKANLPQYYFTIDGTVGANRIFAWVIGTLGAIFYPDQDSLFALPVFIARMSVPMASIVTVSLVASALVSVSTVALATTALVMRDFYTPWRKPDADQEFRATRWVALGVGLVPLLCVFFTPHILELSFFSRALRLSIAIIALVGVYLPFIGSSRAAVTALVASGALTTIWYMLNNPFGIDNMYVAAVVPAVVLFGERLVRKPQATAA